MLFSPFERRAFGQNSLQGFDGWLVKPVRARSLFERLASEFPVVRDVVEPSRAASPARLSRALLAEDNDINAIIAQKALRRLGFEVTRARDGAEAARLAGAATRGEAPRFDIVVMDIKMPGLDGYEAARAIRAIEREIGAPRVAHHRADRQRDAGGPAREPRRRHRRISRQAVRSRAPRRDHRARAGGLGAPLRAAARGGVLSRPGRSRGLS